LQETYAAHYKKKILHAFFLPCADFTGNADMPYDFFLSRYNEAYVTETIAFCDALVNDKPVPCTGEDGLVALIMSIAADKSAAENRWVTFREVVEQVYCTSPTQCQMVAQSDIFPEGFRPTSDPKDLLVPNKEEPKDNNVKGFFSQLRSLISA
jgi:myo-inositol 2-dehydrogenase/D-chiro-inositol 1-dehydrogenase